MAKIETYWLPLQDSWAQQLRAAESDVAVSWTELVALAGSRMDFLAIDRLDRLARRHYPQPPGALSTQPIRLAVLSSTTTGHLLAGIRVAGLRRGLWINTFEADYGQYLQLLLSDDQRLADYAPSAVLLAMDAWHVTAGLDPSADAKDADDTLAHMLDRAETCWRIAQDRWGATVLHQTALPVIPPLLGANEHRLPGSRAALVGRFNEQLRERADAAGVHLVALDSQAAQLGIDAWHDPVLWHRAKQEVSPAAAPVYGDLVARSLAAAQGRSAKCLVLDLDNTLWGGVIGDDGLDGIVLGQGSALGEAFVAVQSYARDLARRGVILAVCSKNDEAAALLPFERHADMVLRRGDIAAFVANWQDKAQNIRDIASELNIGLDAMVFVDDNPFERNLVRSEVPEVIVPEVPDDDPALVPRLLADAGYFEALSITDDDRKRTEQYRGNRDRSAVLATASDLPSYLRSLNMELIWQRFNLDTLSRVVQLINKTNQFNLTTRRMNAEEAAAIMNDGQRFGLQLRLVDRFGDNGIIAVVTGSIDEAGRCTIDDWLMSCRVLGREVERATLGIVVDVASQSGGRELVGIYRPTAKNGMVRNHYAELGFVADPHDPEHRFTLSLDQWQPFDAPMTIRKGRS